MGDWIDIHSLLHRFKRTEKNLLRNTGNSPQYSVMTYMRKESKKRSGYMLCGLPR